MDLEGLSLVYRTAEGTMLNGGACTLAPPSEYDGSISAVAAVQSVANIAIVASYVFCFSTN